jgi:hypothetical protein
MLIYVNETLKKHLKKLNEHLVFPHLTPFNQYAYGIKVFFIPLQIIVGMPRSLGITLHLYFGLLSMGGCIPKVLCVDEMLYHNTM